MRGKAEKGTVVKGAMVGGGGGDSAGWKVTKYIWLDRIAPVFGSRAWKLGYFGI